jgi:hypothetical protein
VHQANAKEPTVNLNLAPRHPGKRLASKPFEISMVYRLSGISKGALSVL